MSCPDLDNSKTHSFHRHDNPSGECHNFPVKIAVFNAEMDPALLHTEIKNSDRNKEVTCPDPVKYTCEMLEGKLTWKKVCDYSDMWCEEQEGRAGRPE